MKTKITLFTLILILLSACGVNQKIEIIPDYDEIYLAKNKLDVAPQILNESDIRSKKFWGELKNNYPVKDKPVFYDFKVILFLSAHGSLEKIKFVKNKINTDKQNAIANPNFEELKKKLTNYFANLNYVPGKLNGNNVSSQLTLTGIYKIDPDGKTRYISKENDRSDYTFFNGDTYFVAVEEMPKIKGGIAELVKRIVYPPEAKNKGIEGRVFVRAFIDENGSVTSAELIKSLGYGCDEAALKAVKETKFIPGKQRGKAVKTQIVIPVTFKLK